MNPATDSQKATEGLPMEATNGDTNTTIVLPEARSGLSASALKANLQAVRQDIANACALANRPADQVSLLAVSKTQSAKAVQILAGFGQKAFGENYLQEALGKIHYCEHQGLRLEWHFIGPIQSNKTKQIAENFAWVHSVDRLVIAQRLNSQRPAHLPMLNICIQVNVSQEASKSGASPDQTLALCQSLVQLPRLTLRGLMAIPAPGVTAELATMKTLFHTVQSKLSGTAQKNFDTLSIGMSDDFPAAIAAGSTMIRLGTLLFGQRPTKL